MQTRAFIFDLNGTMIDDMEYHTKAWYEVLNNRLGAALSWQAVKAEMYGKNEELLVRVFGAGHFTDEEMKALSIEKEKIYQAAYRPYLKLIQGLEDFLKQAKHQHIPMAIGSAAIRFNINFVLDGLSIRSYFSSIVSADDVATSKPNPETFLKAAKELGIAPGQCIVFEDAPKGVEAALHAGMQTIVLTTMHAAEEFQHYSNIIALIKDYTDPRLLTLVK